MNWFNKREKENAAARVRKVRRLRAAGKTWKQIGAVWGISKQRAQQLGKIA